VNVFVLEDDPVRQDTFLKALVGHEVTLVANVEEALRAFSPPYDLVFLDHDLGGQHYVPSEDPTTGYAFVKQAVDRMADCGIVVVHSYNTVGAERMLNELFGVCPHYYAPFGGAKMIETALSNAAVLVAADEESERSEPC
jgi:CheY-like chemotaxis protein